MNKVITNFLKSAIQHRILPNLTKHYVPQTVGGSIIEVGNKLALYKTIDRPFSTISESKDLSFKPAISTGGDFAKIVEHSSIFVDKSLFIKEIIEDPSETILITMPRRWGKSLNLDMLRRFLSIEVDEQGNLIPSQQTNNYKLFHGGDCQVQKGFSVITKQIPQSNLIKQNPQALDTQGKYPVIFIDFKDCKGSSLEEIINAVRYKICNSFKTYSYLETSNKLRKSEQKLVTNYIDHNVKDNQQLLDGVRLLSELLEKHHDQKVWILIDEYDAAANKAYLEFNNEEAKAVVELFRSIFEPALKGNDSLKKSVITGVQYIVKSGMLSGLNNLSKYNVTSTKYSKYYGINESEMELLLEHFDINGKQAAKIKSWYNGYKENIGTAEEPELVDKYNIWSVVNYLNRQDDGFRSYWEKSGSVNNLLKNAFRNQIFKEKIENLVNEGAIKILELKEDFDLDDFYIIKDITNNITSIEIDNNGIDLLFSYLFITGYLTNSDNFEFQFPNKEIRKEMGNYLKEYYNKIFNINPDLFSDLTAALDQCFFTDSKEELSAIFKENFGPKLSTLVSTVELYGKDSQVTNGAFANEDLMHSLLNNIVIQVVNARFASERYSIKPDGSRGRADIVIEKNGKGIIIEMKYKGQSDQALSQAKEYSELVKSSDTQIFLGCTITDQQEVFLSGEIASSDGQEAITFEYP